jgi:hypothetical protein
MIATAENVVSVPEPKSVRMTITPSQAVNWLEHANNHNRSVSDRIVQQYARDMRAGRWRLSHQSIAFDPRGNLIDGQHRLWAVVEAAVPVEMHVWFNVDPASQMVIDMGRPRRLADNLRLGGGLPNAGTNELACLRAMLGRGGCPPLTPEEARQAMERHGEAVAFALEHLAPIGQKGIITAEVRAVVARAWYSADLKRLKRFCEVLRTCVVEEPAEKTVVLLRTVLSTRGGGSVPLRQERYGKTERALAAYLQGQEPLVKLYSMADELFPLPEEESTGK